MLMGGPSFTQDASLTVISNPKGCPSSLKQSELRSIFLGEKQRWRNGEKILIALMKTNTSAGKQVCERVYDMSADELNKYWLQLVFQGKAQAPTVFTSESELQAFIAENPGAIGILIQPPVAANTQVVMIDGKREF
jgi:ABC-type phosphate transport system substrate-binding protein